MKKLLLIVCALLATVGAWAADVTVLPANGVYWKNGAVSSDPWAPTWKSTATASDLTTPLLTFEGQTGMNTANGNIYSNQTYTLTAPSGYVIVGYTFNGTATGADITITPAGGSGTTVASGSSLGTPLSVDVNAQTTTFALASSSDAHFENLALTVKVEHYIVSYSTSTGSYTATNAGGTWASRWESTATDPQVTLSVGANNIQVSNGYIYSGSSTATYTLAAQSGYLITGYEIKGRAQTAAQTLTPSAGGSAVSFGTDQEYTLSVTGLSAQSTTFTQSTPNNGIAISSFKIFLEKDPCTVTYVISDASGVVFTSDPIATTPGETVTELPTVMKRDYCSYSAINQTMAAGDNTVNVTVSYNLPFESGTGKLYYAKLRNHYAYYDATNNDVRTNQSSKENTDNYRWSFSGNPYSGIKMKNEAAGTYLDNTSNTVQLTAGGYGWTIKSLNNTTTFGLFNGSNYINEQNHSNHNLIYWWQFADDAGSQWTVEEVPVNVTYNLEVGGQVVNTIVVEEVSPNSEVAVPAVLTAAYSPLCYDFATSGTIGSTDCTITVTATPKTGLVTALSELSNSKAYTLSTARGDLYIKTDHLASNSNANVGATAGNFAVISFEGNYYLYSTDASKFVQKDGSLSESVTSNVVAVSLTAQSAKNLFLMKIGSNGVNITNTNDDYEVVINAYVTPDAGNQYAIFEAADFDATIALAALDEFFHGPTAFTNAIAQLEAYPYGTGVNQYSLVVESTDYTTQASTIISGLKAQGYSADNLAKAQALITGTTLNTNVPVGFYRIQGKTSGNYLAAGLANNNKFNMSDATDATTIFHFDGSKLTNFGSGMCNGMTRTAWAWVVGESASAVTFSDGESNGGYAIQSSDAFFYDGGTSADRGSSLDSNARYRNWYLEKVTTLPVTISDAKYATLFAPVALTIPSGVQAYYVSALTEKEATLMEITTTIPANTPVILYAADQAAATTYNFDITTAGDFSGTNKLAGQVTAQNVEANSAYTLQRNKADKNIVGLYPKADGTIAGFKAYLPASAFNSGAKGVTFRFADADGIDSIENGPLGPNNSIYNLAGQRLSKPAKGVNIVNGKKIIVK